MKPHDVLAIGTCYVDTNLPAYPFDNTGIPSGVELVGEQYEVVAGGSAVNFCRLLCGFGLKPAFLGMAGDDSNGASLEAALQSDGIEPFIIKETGLLTNISFNMTNASGEHIMLVAGTANAALAPEPVLAQLKSKANNIKMVYLGGCFKLKKLAPAFTDMAAVAQQADAVVVVDHGRIPQAASPEIVACVKELVLKANYYLPSRDEFCQLWEVESIEDGLAMLHDQAPETITVVKDGANGAYYWDEHGVKHIEAPRVDKVINATGAGDSFNAGLVAAVTHGHELADAVHFGCLVGAAKVSGNTIPSL